MSKIATKVMRIAKGTALTLGAAMMLALVLGVSTTAFAGTGVGASFQLGKINAVNAVTKLVGSVVGPSLVIDNNSPGASATALDLRVEAGKAPMKVNSSAKVPRLNSDKLDNLEASAFVRSAYQKSLSTIGGRNQFNKVASISCDAGDFVLSGGYASLDEGAHVSASKPLDRGNGWKLEWLDNPNATIHDAVTIKVVCADVGTPHQK